MTQYQIMEKTKKNDFIEIEYTGYANNEIFDSNIGEDLKKLNPEAKAEKLIVSVGQGNVVKGFDKELEDKELEKEYEITIRPSEAFGSRDRNLMKTIPLSAFTQQQISPKVGMVLALDNHVVKIITVSGARVTVDFNNPLAGKDIKYKFKIIRKVSDEKEKAESLLKFFFGFVPEFEVKDKIIVKREKNLEDSVNRVKERFKELLGKELVFEEQEIKDKN